MSKEQIAATLQACFYGDKNAYKSALDEFDRIKQENDKLESLIELMHYGIQLNDEQQQLLNNVLGGDDSEN